MLGYRGLHALSYRLRASGKGGIPNYKPLAMSVSDEPARIAGQYG